MTTLEIINQIESDKKAALKEPAHALLSEIYRQAKEYYPAFSKQIVDAELEELVKKNSIRIG